MATEQLVRTLTEQSNPIDTDIVEVTHYTGSVYQSLKLTLLNLYTYFKNKIIASGNALKIRTYTFTEADYYTYEPAQYEMVLFVNVRFGTATTIKVGSDGNLEAYISETTNTSTNPNIYCDSSNATDRNINISLNGSGIVTVISILNV